MPYLNTEFPLHHVHLTKYYHELVWHASSTQMTKSVNIKPRIFEFHLWQLKNHTREIDRMCYRILNSTHKSARKAKPAKAAAFPPRNSVRAHTHTQPFYGSVEFVRENPGEPVPEEHSPTTLIVVINHPYQLSPSSTIHGTQ